MPEPAGEKHQLAGFDARERGFNRPVEFLRTSSGFQASLRYEAVHLLTPAAASTADALQQLIHLLHEQGYTQLRSQQSYRDGIYLGSQEPWIEYPDRQPEPELGLLGLLKKWFGQSEG
ncbi:hypothetical protein [Nitrospira defluvii]|uniref:Uncharacterized protein n=1 Tax=Nitrospira defluvii TaxID=330214 RepID=A0ABN7M037_9BACT|nr:hypothetical protein [Nitrospira defluvii]CAE6773598.1 conserved hypothetical protein [Nitrospira defluvii]